LYIDNTPYVFDEERNAVVRYFPPENQRPVSRNNYSSLGDVNMGNVLNCSKFIFFKSK
jgi:hypothetical protein